jgi:hypothetical protein
VSAGNGRPTASVARPPQAWPRRPSVMTLARVVSIGWAAGTMVTMAGYQDRARREAVGSGVADRCRTWVTPRQTPGLTWAFAWQVLDSNQGRLTSTVLQGAGWRRCRCFLPAGTLSEARTACGSTTPQPRVSVDGRPRPDVTGPKEPGYRRPDRLRQDGDAEDAEPEWIERLGCLACRSWSPWLNPGRWSPQPAQAQVTDCGVMAIKITHGTDGITPACESA